ncbi:hypothetical protein AKJ65_07980 [candidate division MSBL1 archaeon SCGC-AAA259E19]|uniref:SpoVT-AbrB domain-containing protein n=2 Tax=candidate division MSBL1 TaxID=215777 RepID=A0A133V4L5_9EURY|nr:hypothetical protein AKJ65_07980 [candidate division MSBL1 archaeon SCGC-AAA259E19]KXB01336.1 hypothetical protein AKJ41_01870 [candidate division MSBL1 archaeon SCGC-AAA259O05]
MRNKEKGEIRKVQLTGGSTYTISLPKKWMDKMELGAGEGMLIEEQGSSLLLSPAKLEREERRESKMEVDPQESVDSINRKILSLYLVGYNVINITSSGDRLNSSQREAIKDFVRKKLVGTEIISESIEEISLRTLLSYSELSVKGALRRMYRVATSMQENAMTALEENDRELAKDVVEIDDEVDRFQMYLIREIKAAIQNPSLLDEIGLKTSRECLGYRLVSTSVERVGDHAATMAKNFLEMENPIDEDSLQKLKEINSLSNSILKKSVESLFDENYEEAEVVIQKLGKIYSLEEEMNQFLVEENPPEAMRIRLILESMRRIAEYGSDVAEIVLNLTVTKQNSSLPEEE